MANQEIPTYRDLLYPTLQAIDRLHGSASKRDINEAVIETYPISEDQLAVSYPPEATAKGSKVLHRLAFARSSLKMCKALDNSTRGVWSLNKLGRELLAEGEAVVIEADRQVRKDLAKARTEKRAAVTAQEQVSPDDEAEAERLLIPKTDEVQDSWRADLLEVLHELPPDAFERLCVRLLAEAGCTDVKTTGGANDEGIDGTAVLQVSLLSFPVFFQAKRYRKPVTPNLVREFRGSLVGRGDKGILITTSRFTPAAEREAQRAGTTPLDLIDGERLCDLLLSFELGVNYRPAVLNSFFDDL